MKISRNVLVAAVAIAAVAACSRTADMPRPTRTLEPSVAPTESVKPSAKRETACSLMTAEERSALAGTTMDQVMPNNPVSARHQCQWVHSLKETVNFSITIEAIDGRDWAKRSAAGLGSSLANPNVDRKRLGEVRRGLIDVRSGKITAERACEIYELLMSIYGFQPGDQVVFPSGNSQTASVTSTSCIAGVFTSVTFTERNLYPPASLFEQVIRARQAVEQRAVERFGADDEPSATPTPSRVR